tara:strand:- start:164 stop:550 length:387 start_codon:yes stop_codon:yes gene_type:complete
MITFFGRLFCRIDLFGINLNTLYSRFRIFFYNHKTLFDLFFLGSYAIEQILLLFLVVALREYYLTVVSIFIVFFLLTMSFERICMESRYNQFKSRIREMNTDYIKLQALNSGLRDIIPQIIRKRKEKD